MSFKETTEEQRQNIRWKKMDTAFHSLFYVFKEYANQSFTQGTTSIFEACPIDFSAQIVNALDEAIVSSAQQIKFAEILAHEIQNSLVPGYKPTEELWKRLNKTQKNG